MSVWKNQHGMDVNNKNECEENRLSSWDKHADTQTAMGTVDCQI